MNSLLSAFVSVFRVKYVMGPVLFLAESIGEVMCCIYSGAIVVGKATYTSLINVMWYSDSLASFFLIKVDL